MSSITATTAFRTPLSPSVARGQAVLLTLGTAAVAGGAATKIRVIETPFKYPSQERAQVTGSGLPFEVDFPGE